MKVAIVGTRTINRVNIEDYVCNDDEIVSGGARGVDSCAADFAKKNGLTLVEFLPDYERYGRAAPIIRNRQIVNYADRVVAFWDGRSKGTLFVINYAKKVGKECKIIYCK